MDSEGHQHDWMLIWKLIEAQIKKEKECEMSKEMKSPQERKKKSWNRQVCEERAKKDVTSI